MSQDYSSDDGGKRKKSTKDMFERSSKTKRTPDTKHEDEDRLGKIMEMILELKGDLKAEIRGIGTELKEIVQEVKILKQENVKLRNENEQLKKEVNLINEKIEKEKRKNNIIVQGIRMDTNEPDLLKEEMLQFIESELKVKVALKGIRKIGDKIYWVELGSIDEKLKIMRNKSKLKNRRGGRIYINDDMTKQQREIQGIIRKIAREEVSKGKTVKIGFGKLMINRDKYKWSVEKGMLEIEDNRNQDTSKN